MNTSYEFSNMLLQSNANEKRRRQQRNRLNQTLSSLPTRSQSRGSSSTRLNASTVADPSPRFFTREPYRRDYGRSASQQGSNTSFSNSKGKKATKKEPTSSVIGTARSDDNYSMHMTTPILEKSRNSSMLMSPNLSQRSTMHTSGDSMVYQQDAPVTSKRRISSPVRYTASPKKQREVFNDSDLSQESSLLQPVMMSPIKNNNTTKSSPETTQQKSSFMTNGTVMNQGSTMIELDQVTQNALKHSIMDELYTILAGEFDINLTKLAGLTHQSGAAESSYYRYLQQQPTQKLMKTLRVIKSRYGQGQHESQILQQETVDQLQKRTTTQVDQLKQDIVTLKRAVALSNEKQDLNQATLKEELEKVQRYSKLVHEYQKEHIQRAMDTKAISQQVDLLVNERLASSTSSSVEYKEDLLNQQNNLNTIMSIIHDLQEDVRQQNKVIKMQHQELNQLKEQKQQPPSSVSNDESSTSSNPQVKETIENLVKSELVNTKQQLNLQSQDIEGVNDQLIKLNGLVNDLRAIISRQSRQIVQLNHQNKALSISMISEDSSIMDTSMNANVTEPLDAFVDETPASNESSTIDESLILPVEEDEDDDVYGDVRVRKIQKPSQGFCVSMFLFVVFLCSFLVFGVLIVHLAFPEATTNVLTTIREHPRFHHHLSQVYHVKDVVVTHIDNWLSSSSTHSDTFEPPAHDHVVPEEYAATVLENFLSTE